MWKKLCVYFDCDINWGPWISLIHYECLQNIDDNNSLAVDLSNSFSFLFLILSSLFYIKAIINWKHGNFLQGILSWSVESENGFVKLCWFVLVKVQIKVLFWFFVFFPYVLPIKVLYACALTRFCTLKQKTYKVWNPLRNPTT